MLLVIDNFDSFTYNLVQYFGQLGVKQQIFRNNAISVDEAIKLDPDRIVISPGPGSPCDGGVSLDMINAFAQSKPIFGVCLGHQCIGQYFGGKIKRAQRLMHGKTSSITHNGENVFKELPSPIIATRYHSLIVDRMTLPECLKVSAESEDGEIMGLAHNTLPIWGVQFHPESLATEKGIQVLKNFLEL